MDNDYYQPLGKSQEKNQELRIKPCLPAGRNQGGGGNAQDEADEKEFAEFIAETKEKIIGDLGFESATQEQKDKILEAIEKRIMVATTQAVIESATDEEAQKIKSAIEADSDIEETVGEIVQNNPAMLERIKQKISALYQKIIDESKGVLGKTEEPAAPKADDDPHWQNKIHHQDIVWPGER